MQHPWTLDEISFLGQGETVAEALKDGVANLSEPYRPKNDGRMPTLTKVGVRKLGGERVLMTLKEFEALGIPPPPPPEDVSELF